MAANQTAWNSDNQGIKEKAKQNNWMGRRLMRETGQMGQTGRQREHRAGLCGWGWLNQKLRLSSLQTTTVAAVG